MYNESLYPGNTIPMSTIYQKFFESFCDSYATIGDLDQTMRLRRLISIYTGHERLNQSLISALRCHISGFKRILEPLDIQRKREGHSVLC